MTIRTLSKNIYISCTSYNTRNGFGHRAVLVEDYIDMEANTMSFTNRTWERYQYESVMKGLLWNVSNASRANYEKYIGFYNDIKK